MALESGVSRCHRNAATDPFSGHELTLKELSLWKLMSCVVNTHDQELVLDDYLRSCKVNSRQRYSLKLTTSEQQNLEACLTSEQKTWVSHGNRNG